MENVSSEDTASSTVILPQGFVLSTERLLHRERWVSDGFEVRAWRPVPGRVAAMPSGVEVHWTTPTGEREKVQVTRASAHEGNAVAVRLADRGLRIDPDQHTALNKFFALVIAY